MRIHHGFEADGKKGNKKKRENNMLLSFNRFYFFSVISYSVHVSVTISCWTRYSIPSTES